MWFEELLIAIKASLVLKAPEGLRPLVSAALSTMPILSAFGGLFAVVTLWREKCLDGFEIATAPTEWGPSHLSACGRWHQDADQGGHCPENSRSFNSFSSTPGPAGHGDAGAIGDSLRAKARGG